MVAMMNQDAPYSGIAGLMSAKGRYGDTELLHVRPDELAGLASVGQLTINPDTGLPEAFSFKSLLPTIGAIAGAALAPFTGGASLGLTTGLMAGGGAFLGGLAAGQGVGQAALGGLVSGVTAGFMAGAPTGIDAVGGAGAGFSEGAMSGVGSAADLAVEASMQGIPSALPTTAASSAIPSSTAAALPSASGNLMSGASSADLAIEAAFGPGLGISPSITPAPVAQTLGSSYTTAAPLASTGAEASFSESLAKEGLGQYLPEGSIGSAEKFARINPKTYEAPSKLRQAFGAEDFTGRNYITKQEYIDAGGVTGDMTLGQRVGQLASSPGTYLGAAGSVLMQPPEYEELDIQEPTLGPSYVPRERTLAGGVQSPARSSEEYLRMALEGGYQPLSEQYRYVAQGGLVGLAEGGQTKQFIDQPELTQMSITPESQRVRNNISQPQQNISNRVFDQLESKGGIMSIMSRLLLRNNPEVIQFLNQNASSPRNLQLNEMGGGRHSYFDTADTGLYPKAAGGLVRLVEGGTPEQGVLQSQLSPVVQQQQQTPLLQQQEQQISERARQDELLQRDQAMSRGQQFIEQPTGKQQLFQQMQNVGQVIGQQLVQGPESYATPPGQSAAPSSFVSGTSFGFNTGGLVGLAEGGVVSLKQGGEPDQIENVLPVTLQSTMKRLGIKDATPFLEFAQKTKQIESSGGVNRINPDSSARGDFQWLTKVDPKAKKGVHGSVKTAVNRTIASYKRMGQEIPQWLKTLNKNSTESTKDLEANVLSLTPDQELELFFGNIGEAEGSDVYLNEIAKGNQQAMFEAYSDIHHTRGKEDQPTKEKAIKTFFSDSSPQINIPDEMTSLSETMTDTRPDQMYTVQRGDTLSQLAAKSGMSIEDLMAVNLSRISDPDKIYAGQQIALSDSPDIPNPVPISEEDNDGLMNLIRKLLPNFTKRAHGGEVGKYFEGQVVGNGDGMSDQILFEVEGNNPDKALLSRDEYVIPADVVAMLGNGSSNAGSEQLDNFIKGIRQDSFGTQKQQRQLNAQQGLGGLV